jgi:hypothetical protein
MLRTGVATRHLPPASCVRSHPHLGATLLAAWTGDAGPGIAERFERETRIDDALGETLVAGNDAAVIVLAGRRAIAAAAGHARLYMQRAHELTELAPGGHDVGPSTQFLASSTELRTGIDVFETGAGFQLAEAMIRGFGNVGMWEVGDKTFRVDTLDELLARALEGLDARASVAGAALGFLRASEVRQAQAFPLTAELLEMAAAVSPAAKVQLVTRCGETAPDYDALPAAIRDVHAVEFLAGSVGRDGAGLEEVVRSYGPRGKFVTRTLSGLARVGATRHAEILCEAIPLLAHYEPGLDRVMAELGLAPVPRANHWTLANAWADAPELSALSAWYVMHADILAGTPAPSPPRELVYNPPRATLVAQISAKFGAVSEDTPLASLSPDTVSAIERAFELPPSFEPYEPGSTLTALLHRVYDTGKPWALS